MNIRLVFPLLLMLASGIGVWYLSRKKSRTPDYDEMQLKIRARGYRLGFFTALILLVLMILLSELELLTFVTPGLAAFAVLIVSVGVFAVFCIAHDAFLGVRENGKSQIGIFLAIVILDGINTVRYIREGKFLENGQLTFGSGAPALMFLIFLAVLIALIVRIRQAGKEAEE